LESVGVLTEFRCFDSVDEAVEELSRKRDAADDDADDEADDEADDADDDSMGSGDEIPVDALQSDYGFEEGTRRWV
jgi:hypothetical protein